MKASANLYSLIETATKSRRHEAKPTAWNPVLICVICLELPRAETVEAIEALLPGKIDKDQIRIG